MSDYRHYYAPELGPESSFFTELFSTYLMHDKNIIAYQQCSGLYKN